MIKSIYVPTLVDANNHNAQVLNARALLADWDAPDWQLQMHAYNEPDPLVLANNKVAITRLWRRHAWYLHYFLRYLRPCDLIFYPGIYPMDSAGLRWRKRLGLSAPVIATLEALAGDATRDAEYSALAGHAVHCQHVSKKTMRRVDEILTQADHIIAISPFLAKLGSSRYGNKFSVLPLGIDDSIFYAEARKKNKRVKVIAAGTFQAWKRPELFLNMAHRYPTADFIWYGEGNHLRLELQERAKILNINNLSFPGALSPRRLGEAFRAADIFIMPSISEGVPKVSQEAAACGLAQVIFGYYESPSVVDGRNGFVVWSDEAFGEKIGELINNNLLMESFGKAGIEMAVSWHWTTVAKQWRDDLITMAARL